jgi:hypothetical protein
MCMVTQITCAKSAEFCKDETLRLLAEQRRSNMEEWNCAACGTLAHRSDAYASNLNHSTIRRKHFGPPRVQ